MALFKIYRGSDSKRLTDPNYLSASGVSSIPQGEDSSNYVQNNTDHKYYKKLYINPKDGNCYFDLSTGLFYIDANISETSVPNLKRAPLNAHRALRDGDGNIITTTYAPKADAVLTIANQEITDVQKKNARDNINAITLNDVPLAIANSLLTGCVWQRNVSYANLSPGQYSATSSYNNSNSILIGAIGTAYWNSSSGATMDISLRTYNDNKLILRGFKLALSSGYGVPSASIYYYNNNNVLTKLTNVTLNSSFDQLIEYTVSNPSNISSNIWVIRFEHTNWIGIKGIDILGDGVNGLIASEDLSQLKSIVIKSPNIDTAYNHSQLTSGNPHRINKNDVGLGNVGNFKAVSTIENQGLTDAEKLNARANIGAGTSSFNGDYNNLINKPSIPSQPSDIGAQPAGNYKVIQTAKNSPSENGSSASFIDSIQQNANGEITATKKYINTSGMWLGTSQKALQDSNGVPIRGHYAQLTDLIQQTSVSHTTSISEDTSVQVSFDGLYMSSYVINEMGKKIICDETIGDGNVLFEFTKDVISSTYTCFVNYSPIIRFYIDDTMHFAGYKTTSDQWANSRYNYSGWYRKYGNILTNGTYQVSMNSPLQQNDKYTKEMDPEHCCFVAGTKILMADNTEKNIEDIEIGDLVVSYDINNNQKYIAKVIGLPKNIISKNMAQIIFENGTNLFMTEYHPIYTTEGWRSLTEINNYPELKVGDKAITANGESTIIDIIKYQNENNVITYNLNVKDLNEENDNDINDNFFANGVCVHNAACPS